MNIIKSIHRSSFPSLALASVMCLVGSVQVLAADPATVHSITVSYRDLDLSRPAGADTLYRRIKGAAKEVCGYEGSSLMEIIQWQRCVKGAVTDAVADVNSPLLTALHAGKSPDSTETAMLRK